jgi:hypothetical protein
MAAERPALPERRPATARRIAPPVPAVGRGRLPNLLVIGAQKAGTTWLHRRLAAHPAILMSRPKELNFFAARDPAARLDAYRAHFPETPGKLFYGESTPGYFWTHDAASPWCLGYSLDNRDIAGSVLAALGPEVRLVLSLRHPVDRAISAFYHHFRRGRLGAAARLTEAGRQHGIIDMGFYVRHHAAWSARFGAEALITVLFDRIAREPEAVLAEIHARLGLPTPAPQPVAAAEHPGLRLRLRDAWLEVDPDSADNQALLRRWERRVEDAPRVHAEDVALLLDLYRDDIRFGQRLLADAAGVDWLAQRSLADFVTPG